MFRKHLLVAAVTAIIAGPSQAADFSSAVFFGDSLSDAGTYAGEPPMAGLFPIAGSFTTNPGDVWTQMLADQLSHPSGPANQGGTIYAAGGARVTAQPGYPNNPLVPFVQAAPPVSAQIDSHLAATGGRADANGLYAVWAGANDLFALADGDAAYGALPMPQVAANLAAQVQRLTDAGARYIVVPNLPDIGATPTFTTNGPLAQALATQQVRLYNSTLYGELAARGIRVIPIDTFGLLAQVQADAARFGITNISDPACAGVPSSLVCTAANYPAGADQSYIFADGVHPTTAIHRILADHVFSVLSAPQQIARLADSGIAAREMLHEQLRAQLLGGDGARTADGRHVWLSAQGARLDRERTGTGPGVDDESYRFAAGVDYRLDTRWTIGAALSASDGDADFDDRRGSYSMRDVALSLYGGWRGDHWFGRGALAYGESDYSIDRRVPLGIAAYTARGDTDGSNASALIEGGYTLRFDRLSTGPVLGLLAQHLRIDGFNERGAGVIDLGFAAQERHLLIGSAGWEVSWHGQQLQPYARFSIDRDFEDNHHAVEVRALSVPEALPFSMPVEGAGRTRYNALVGVAGEVADTLRFNVGASQQFARENQRALQLFGTLSLRF